MPTSLPLVQGSLDVLVLKTISWAPMHGFEISRWIEERSSGAFEVDESALYQALYRLESRGYVSADWGVTANNRRARYYTLTSAGRTQLRAESKRWTRYAEALASVLSATAAS